MTVTTTQLPIPIPMKHIEKENFTAQLVHDYGPEWELYFTVFVEETGEIWTFGNRVLRAQKNITMGRTFDA